MSIQLKSLTGLQEISCVGCGDAFAHYGKVSEEYYCAHCSDAALGASVRSQVKHWQRLILDANDEMRIPLAMAAWGAVNDLVEAVGDA